MLHTEKETELLFRNVHGVHEHDNKQSYTRTCCRMRILVVRNYIVFSNRKHHLDMWTCERMNCCMNCKMADMNFAYGTPNYGRAEDRELYRS